MRLASTGQRLMEAEFSIGQLERSLDEYVTEAARSPTSRIP
ncbi:MAG: hypothetical protein U5R31_14705 [Acidimicrobiia bacterium]|nr:hypothetical protein [Acidimicrobiia bacterium]